VEALARDEVHDEVGDAALRLAGRVELDDARVALAAEEELGLAPEALTGDARLGAEDELGREGAARGRADLEDDARAPAPDPPHDLELAEPLGEAVRFQAHPRSKCGSERHGTRPPSLAGRVGERGRDARPA